MSKENLERLDDLGCENKELRSMVDALRKKIKELSLGIKSLTEANLKCEREKEELEVEKEKELYIIYGGD